MNILVTGGAGFIGSNFIHYMLKNYETYKIINYDALTYSGNLNNVKSIQENPNYSFVKGKIQNGELLEHVVKERDVQVIVNFAAESHVDRSIENPIPFYDTNVIGTVTLLELVKKYSHIKLVQVSTDEVYGSLGKTGKFTEETPLAPNSPYSSSKASSDMIALSYYETYQLPVIITRCSNNYGPYQYPEKLIPLMVTNALEGKKLPLYGDGLNVRDWLHVTDHCSAIDTVLHKGCVGEVYNIGGNNEKTNVDVVEQIIKLLGKTKKDIEFVTDRLGHDRRYAIDAQKMKNEFEWEPKYTFEQGLKETVEWYKNNVDWWKPLKEK
ncbi:MULTISPECIES: dTDP-glucose 4,6-dehydratase [Bacillus]|jgi:dTDP-glucose 4,6-dehydratase|uniref:dTDP-glucose 4,6-dehydratase n=3 Tax=Bacillus cereus group TaxID=86661 RepID=A0A0B5RUR4_BACMY|nr:MULTISPECIES: dTDP-glucose 4,6-dehydratase [Bacillus]EJS10460.1 dTDP-glucose 4,6-dehydratase [Bacillus cereus VDM034]EJS12044.1 dTDP-glucose 4,6-dehydratase [Bacillus cereus VDM062]AJH18550.1 dTDP-glucose 4,6-dehydratase [Bacillus mycoides]EEM00480.1 DTDP-glucose 4,6-dehydratase [Bacillus mycoides DSM 2048]EJQ61816.1 dTDP-glucose 4,6-dehydratase [Bacillus mycoides]